MDLWLFWAVWLVSLGILIGKAFNQPRQAEMVCLSIALLIFGTLVIRAVPIHSLGWGGCSRIVISKPSQNWKIEITDPGEVEIFRSYGGRGHYQTMLKCGDSYHLYVGDETSLQGYYVHGDSIGRFPGGAAQSVFIPTKGGLMDFLKGMLKRHGHEVK
jgi:hypothetical protein